MAHVTANRVLDTSTTTGTGAFTLAATPPSGYRTFSAVCSTSDTFFYCIAHQTAAEWEVGLGTYSAANTLTRTTVLQSSNAGSAVNFSAGTKDVFLTMAANKTIQVDASDNVTTPGLIADSKGDVRDLPILSKTAAYILIASDAGKTISITTGGVTVNASVHSAGDVISIYNNSGSSQTITQGTSVTLRQAGTANTGNRTLAQRGLCTVLCVAADEFVITGVGLS